MFLDDVSVSWSGVLIAAIVYFIIGTIWYSPLLFGNPWGRCEEKVGMENKEITTLCKVTSYVGEFVLSLIIAYVLSLFIQISQVDEIVEGVTVALWVWVGFIATTHFSAVLWARKTLKHFFIHAGFMLVGLLAMGAAIVYFGL